MGWAEMTAYEWVGEWLANGILIEVPSSQSGQGARKARLFTLSPEWGGTQPKENAR